MSPLREVESGALVSTAIGHPEPVLAPIPVRNGAR